MMVNTLVSFKILLPLFYFVKQTTHSLKPLASVCQAKIEKFSAFFLRFSQGFSRILRVGFSFECSALAGNAF